jgi:hypothetical protein
VNRIRRRFVDRVLSLFYPVHRYHCRSFACHWEGNLRVTPALWRWEALESHTNSPSTRVHLDDEDAKPWHESDTLPMPPTRSARTKIPNVRADSRDGTKVPRRAAKRAKAVPR